MPDVQSAADENAITRDRLAELLNEDLSREYQAIIAYVVYSQVLSGAQYMDIAASSSELHAKQELDHALILAADRLSRQDALRSCQAGAEPRRTRSRCSGLIWIIAKTRPFAITAIAVFSNASAGRICDGE